MTQKGFVSKQLPDGFVEVTVLRESACGGSCEHCGGCSQKGIVRTRASNPLGAAPGALVEISTRSRQILGAAALVYLTPIAFFFAGYALSAGLGLSENASILASVGSLLLGVCVYTLLGRFVLSKRRIEYTITSILKETRDG